MGNVDSLPEELVQSYYDMLKEDIKERLKEDEDYQEKKHDGNSPYPDLDRL